MLNKAVLMGRLTRDPEMRHTQSGRAVTSFTLACDRDFKAQDGTKQTDFIDIVTWGSTAEFAAKWFNKGQLVAVCGRVQARAWKDKEGNNRKSVEIVADEVHFAESKRDGGGPRNISDDFGGRPSPGFEPDAPSGFEAISPDEDELPF